MAVRDLSGDIEDQLDILIKIDVVVSWLYHNLKLNYVRIRTWI